MAFDLGSVIAHIKTDTSGFTSGIAEAKASLGGFSTFMGSAAKGSAIFAAGLTAVAAGATLLGGMFVKSAAGVEQTRVGFEGLLGSGEAAGKMMRNITKMAAETPFEFPQLAQSARLLLSFGDTAESVLPHLRIIGDTVSTMGGGAFQIDQVTRAIGQMSAKGKITAEEMNQLSEVGINGFALLAQATGKSEGELRALSATGDLAAKDMLPKLYEQMNKNYGGGMIAQSKTLTGLLSTLKDNAMGFGRSLVGMQADGTVAAGSLFDKLRTGVGGLIDFLSAHQQDLQNFIKTFFGGMIQFAPVIIGIILGGLVPALVAFAGAIWAALVPLWPFLLVGAAIGAAFMLLQPYFGTIAGFIMGTVVPVFGELWNQLQRIWAMAMPFIQQAITALMPSFQALGNTIITQLWPAIQNLYNGFIQFYQWISPVLIPVLIALAAVLGALVVGAIWLVINVINVLYNVISWSINMWVSMANIVETVWNTIWAVISAVIGFIIAYFRTVFSVYAAIFNAMASVASAIWGWIVSIVGSAMNAISSFFRNLGSIWASVAAGIRGVCDGVASFMRSIFEGAVSAIGGTISHIAGFVSNMVGAVRGAVSGVKDAITSPFKAAVDEIGNLMNKAKGFLSNLNPFQRHSPSIVDWVKRGTRVIANEYDKMNNSIEAGTIGARVATIGTVRSVDSISENQIAPAISGGNSGGSFVINLTGVLADSPEAKRQLGVDIIQAVNDARTAKGQGTI